MSVIETSINICDQVNIDKVLPLTQKNGIGVIAKRPIANAAWKKCSRGCIGRTRVYIDRLAKMPLDPKDFHMDWPELALRFTLSQPGVHASRSSGRPIPTMPRRMSNMREEDLYLQIKSSESVIHSQKPT